MTDSDVNSAISVAATPFGDRVPAESSRHAATALSARKSRGTRLSV